MFPLVQAVTVRNLDLSEQFVCNLLIGFFSKENYGFLQFTAGLDELQPDATAQFVTVAVVVSFALPVLVAIIAIIIILKRRFSHQPSRIAYDEINN